MKYLSLPNGNVKLPLPNWSGIKQFFPYPEPRKYQAEVISVAEHYLDSREVNDVIIQMPTGIGKSGISATLLKEYRGFGGAVYTPTLGLTEQYRKEFNWLSEVRGRANFNCLLDCRGCPKRRCRLRSMGFKCTAATAYCVTNKKFKCLHLEECPYNAQKQQALTSPYRLSSPQFIFNIIKWDERWHTKIAIFDEGHRLPGLLMDMLTGAITLNDLKVLYGFNVVKLPDYDHDDINVWNGYFEEIGRDAYNSMSNLMEGERCKDEETYTKLEKIVKNASLGHYLIEKDNIVITREDNRVTFKPVVIGTEGHTMLNAVADKRIYMSGTLFNPALFCKELGLDEGKTMYINVQKSLFPAANRPIYPTKSAYLNYSALAKSLPRIVEDIKKILVQHSEERGVIFPHSHKLREMLQANMPRRVITFKDNKQLPCPTCKTYAVKVEDVMVCDRCGTKYVARDRDAQLNRFLTDLEEPLVLNNVYTTEGFDFGTDKDTGRRIATFMIIVKLPYPPLQDRYIQKRLCYEQKDYIAEGCEYEGNADLGGICGSFRCNQCKSWYNNETVNKLVQMSGRIIRDRDDKGSIYILDKGWGRFYGQVEHLLPEWFKESIRSDVPVWLKRKKR